MMYPLVLDLAAKDAPIRVPVTVTCRMLKFSKQAFYAWKKKPFSNRDWDDAHLINAAFDEHVGDPTLGYRFIADELAAAGFIASERRVWRLCSSQAIWSVISKKKGLRGRAGPPVHDNLVLGDFTAGRPNEVWLTAIPPSTSCREVPPPSIGLTRGNCICVRSRTCIRTGSWATRSTRG